MKMSPISAKRSSSRIRILGIAPYEGMKTNMEKIASEMPGIELDVFVGDLEQGVEIVKSRFHKDYDVIISRGGTAQLIEKKTNIPVVEVDISVYDILRTIKLAENYDDRYAIVGFSNITMNANILCDLLQYQIDIFTIHDADEVEQVLRDLKEKGYRMVLCDMISQTVAKRQGMNAMLIVSGMESLKMAFEEAVKLSRSYANVKAENRFLQELLRNGYQKLVVLNEAGEMIATSLGQEMLDLARSVLKQELPSAMAGNTEKFICEIKGTRYFVMCRKLDKLEERCCAFYFSPGSVLKEERYRGISYCNRKEAEDVFFESLYSIIIASNHAENRIDNINQSASPVLLVGEPGSGKEPAARYLYSRSAGNTHPLITVHCPFLTEESRSYLIEDNDSLLLERDNTIYFRDITALNLEERRRLLALILDSEAHKRNRLIFSCNSGAEGEIPPEAMEFVNELSCVTMSLKPLREQVDKLPALISIYLNMINVNSTNPIIGLEPEALKLLQAYRWPNNLSQFKRILSELSQVTATPYIRAEDVEELLKKERESSSEPQTEDAELSVHKADRPELCSGLSGTLSEITGEIVRRVLEECGGNQSAAAKRLGIGRSTLWRYLNK